MQPGFEPKGLVWLAHGTPLRLNNAAGRHLSVVSGVVWITQQGDLGDPVLKSGETFRFDRGGLALVTPLGGPAQVLLEDGLRAAPAERGTRPIFGWFERLACGASRALRMRRTARELNALSDYMLRDVGLRRDQIEGVARRVVC